MDSRIGRTVAPAAYLSLLVFTVKVALRALLISISLWERAEVRETIMVPTCIFRGAVGAMIVSLTVALSGCALLSRLPANPSLTGQIKALDLEDLEHGRLLALRDRYEIRGPDSLTDQELAVLCDIYVRHVSIDRARQCLNRLDSRVEVDSRRIREKGALIEYLTGNYGLAAKMTEDADTYGGRYVHALARAHLGDPEYTADIARRWVGADDPSVVYLGSNLYLATGHYAQARAALDNPFRRLARDYSLTASRDAFQREIRPVPLKVDLFDEFGFGISGRYTFAPPANLYVEFMLAKTALELGRTDEARERLDKILREPDLAAHRDIQWRVLYERGRVAESDGQVERAEGLYTQSLQIIEGARSSISTDAGRAGFVGDKQDVYAALVALESERGNVRSAYEYTERARSRALVDLLATQQQFGARAKDRAESEALLGDYERAEIELGETTRQSSGAGEAERRTRNLTARGRRLVDLLAPEVAVQVTVHKPSLPRIQRSLGGDEALLSYYKDRVWRLFVVSRTAIRELVLESDGLEEDVAAVRQAFESGGDYQALSRRLYDRLIKPVEGLRARRLTIVPFGPLHYLPFAALLTPDDDFLVETRVLALLPSAEVRRFLRPEPRSRKVLAVGNPTGPGLSALPGAEREARMVAQSGSQHDVKLLVGQDAKKQSVLKHARGKEVIHMASHAEFDSQNALRSRIMLGPREGVGDLTMNDLFRVEPPWGARITVLSACRTGLAVVKPGQEIVGLKRGFLFAGTDGILSTLWDIDDETPTYHLMERFYHNYFQGYPAAKALQLAQSASIGRHTHPRDWAAFTYTGLHR